jgi:hypothetical protein
MNIPLLDRSNYLKGLFVTAKLDKELCAEEKEILKKISVSLGFASDFYSESIRGLLSNKYINAEPILFSDREIARSFLKDALTLACCNNKITKEEINWLKKTAQHNNIQDEFVEKELESYHKSPGFFTKRDFALFSII